MRRDDEILVIGIFSPHLHDSKYDGVYIKSSEMSNICKKLVGLPVLIEHEEGTNVGTVMAAWKDDAGNGKCIFSLDVDDSDLSKSVHEKIKSRSLQRPFSRHLAKVDMESLSVTEKVPLEVSVCSEGARPGTHILACSAAKKRASAREHKNANTIEAYILKMQGSNNNKRAEYLKMSSSENPQSDAKEDTSAAMSAASPEEKKSDAAPMDTSSDFNINDVQALMNELQKQREQIKMLQEANNSLDEVGKKRRKNSIPQIEEFIQQLMSTYGEKLGITKNPIKTCSKAWWKIAKVSLFVSCFSAPLLTTKTP